MIWTRSAVRAGALGVAVSFVFLAASGSDAAAPRPITGKLSKPGHSVIALTQSGKAKLVRARRRTGTFRVRPPARSVTLHLRAPDGTYAGPIVVGRRGSRAVVGVRAGARLGKIKVNARRGYARVARKLPKRRVDPRRWARARKGVPIGAGNFGRVRSRPVRGAVPGDLDLDGIPDRLDIDDNGNRILDNSDRSRAARSSQAESAFHVFSDLSLSLDRTVNRNAGSTDAEIDAALPIFGILRIAGLPGDSAELDCGDPDTGLVYCRKNGSTGRVLGGPAFPGCCDPDNDGFGTLTRSGPAPGAPMGGGMGLSHGATTAQIGTGDVLVQWVATGTPESQCPPPSASCASFPSTLEFVFATVPALVSFSDGQGPRVTVSYPVPAAGGPGTQSNPFPVKADPSTGDVMLKLTSWRPQRRPIPGEPGYSDPQTAWTDIGGLAYTASVADIGGLCPQTAFSESDRNLTPATTDTAPKVFNSGRGGVMDQALDQPADPANTFTYTLNLTKCLAANKLSFNPGEVRGFDFQGITPNFGGVADQLVYFKRQ